MVLVEQTCKNHLSYIAEAKEENGKRYLGTLKGIGADFKNPTRNGHRYPLELWENVQRSDDFKEGMETKTIFGETDHPSDESGRIDTSIKEVAIVLTDYQIDRDSGYVNVQFDILDTPQGNILKSLLDYGSKIGVSSRGLGDEIVRNGETIVDPDTYMFYGFDAVVMPAVKAARPAVVESMKKANLCESFQKEIDNATSMAELKSIKKIAEKIDLPEFDSIKESIDNKLKEHRNDISSGLLKDLQSISGNAESLKEKVVILESDNKKKDIRLKQVANKAAEAISELSKLKEENQRLNQELEDLSESIYDGTTQIKDLINLKESNQKQIGSLKEQLLQSKKSNRLLEQRLSNLETKSTQKQSTLTETLKKVRQDSNSKQSRLQSNISALEENLGIVTKSNTRLKEQLQSANKQIETLNQLKETNNKLKKQNKDVKSRLDTFTEGYIAVTCQLAGLQENQIKSLLGTNLTKENIDKVILAESNKKTKLNNLPFYGSPVKVQFNQVSVDEETQQSAQLLKEFYHND